MLVLQNYDLRNSNTFQQARSRLQNIIVKNLKVWRRDQVTGVPLTIPHSPATGHRQSNFRLLRKAIM